MTTPTFPMFAVPEVNQTYAEIVSDSKRLELYGSRCLQYTVYDSHYTWERIPGGESLGKALPSYYRAFFKGYGIGVASGILDLMSQCVAHRENLISQGYED